MHSIDGNLAVRQDKALRLSQIITTPDIMDVICDHVSNGGSLTDLCQTWDVWYHRVIRWINADPVRQSQYEQALKDQSAWAIQRVLAELRKISTVDITKIMAPDGSLLPSSMWPEDVRIAVSSVNISVTEDGTVTHSIKLWDKLKALEMIAKQLGLLASVTNNVTNNNFTFASMIEMASKAKVIDVHGTPTPQTGS